MCCTRLTKVNVFPTSCHNESRPFLWLDSYACLGVVAYSIYIFYTQQFLRVPASSVVVWVPGYPLVLRYIPKYREYEIDLDTIPQNSGNCKVFLKLKGISIFYLPGHAMSCIYTLHCTLRPSWWFNESPKNPPSANAMSSPGSCVDLACQHHWAKLSVEWGGNHDIHTPLAKINLSKSPSQLQIFRPLAFECHRASL